MSKNNSDDALVKPSDVPTYIKSIQLDLFGFHVANDKDQVSNTIEVWDSIPKYFFNTKLVEKLRNSEGHANPFTWNYPFTHANGNVVDRSVTIQPAQIEQKDGSYKAYFPTATEELIEEILKKFLADQQKGIHDVDRVESWVMFTLREIYRELAKVGRTRDITQIKHSIEVMSKCHITVKEGEEVIYSGSILSDLFSVNRKKYKDNPEQKWMAKLALPISIGINKLAIRQFNSERYARLDEPLARWIYRKLINRFTQAGYNTTYHFLYSSVKGESALLQVGDQAGRRKVISALDEEKEKGIILQYDVEDKKEGRKIVDTVYTLYPGPAFIQEQKAANLRRIQIEEKASKAGMVFTP